MKDLTVVRCPVCGQNYLPSEIFMPDSFFGKQRDITRNASGEIEFYQNWRFVQILHLM